MNTLKLVDGSLWKEQAFINGQWAGAESGQTTEIRNPATGEVLGKVPHMGASETRRAIDSAHAALPAWSKKTAGERARIMRKWFDLMLANQEDLAVIMTAEQGKPLAEVQGRDRLRRLLHRVVRRGSQARLRRRDPRPPGRQAHRGRSKQPVGVVAAITPWNFPAAMITRKAGPALAAGCTMVVKPAPQTPFSALAWPSWRSAPAFRPACSTWSPATPRPSAARFTAQSDRCASCRSPAPPQSASC